MRIAKLLLVLVLTGAATTVQAQIGKTTGKKYITGPSAFVYKTKGNYTHLVAVQLSDDKSKIVSYPHPRDLVAGGKLLLPTALHKGYLLDNKGIGANVAFIKMTYEQYAKLENPPSASELYDMIVDKDPLTTLWNCGLKTNKSNTRQRLNKMIDGKKLTTHCKVVR